MARIPLIAKGDADPEISAFYTETEQWLKPQPGPRAGGAMVPQPWRALAHSPDVARWARDGGRLFLTQNAWSLAHPRLRQLAILTVSRRLGCEYAYVGHWPHSELAGLTRAQFDAFAGNVEQALTCGLFDEEQTFVIRVADELTRSSDLSQSLLDGVLKRWGAKGAVELTMLVGFYLMSCTYLKAFGIEDD